MGADDKSPVWNIRVTITDKNPVDKVLEFSKAYSAVKLVCLEEADKDVNRPHVHIAYVPEKSICRSTVKAHLNKYFDISGNTDYSMSMPVEGTDLNGLYRYICKGKSKAEPPAILWNIFKLIDVKKYHDEYYEAQEAFTEKVKTLAAKRQKEGIKEKYKIISELSQKYKGREATVQTVDSIVTDVLSLYKGNVNDNTLFTAVQSISWEIDPNATSLQACERMRRKFFSNYRT